MKFVKSCPRFIEKIPTQIKCFGYVSNELSLSDRHGANGLSLPETMRPVTVTSTFICVHPENLRHLRPIQKPLT